MRKTKIVATVGPATEKEEIIGKLMDAGANMFRFNMKYSPNEWHNKRIALIRRQAKKRKIFAGVMVDIPRNDFAIEIEDYDFIALSYLKSASDVVELKNRLKRKGMEDKVIAKIENMTAMDNLAEIIEAADGIMVARGDLGRETPIEELAFFQKKIIDAARVAGKPVIVATEMLYSMITKDSPTRAEATDVANAVFDGTDGIMLSEETAMGKYPVEAVKVMNKIASFCESTGELRKLDLPPRNLTDALTASAAWISKSIIDKPIKSLVVFSRAGTTVKLVSRYRLVAPIIAICNDQKTLNRLNLCFGVIPYFKMFDTEKYEREDKFFDELIAKNLLKKGDQVMIIHGDMWYGQGPANRLSIRTV